MIEQGAIELLAAEFTIEIRDIRYDLVAEMRGLVALNAFHFDTPVIKEFQLDLQRKTAKLFKKYFLWRQQLEDIISFWECNKIELDNDEAMEDYVSSVTALFIHTFRRRNDPTEEAFTERVMHYINVGHLDSPKENPDRKRFVDFTKICAYSMISRLVNITEADFRRFYAKNNKEKNKKSLEWIDFTKDETGLNTLFDCLKEEGYLNCKRTEFKHIFYNRDLYQKVKWQGNAIELIYLYHLLLENNIITGSVKPKDWKKLQRCFEYSSIDESSNLSQIINGGTNLSKKEYFDNLIKSILPATST